MPKPFTTEQLEHLIRKVEMLVDLQRENSRLRAGSGDWFDGADFTEMPGSPVRCGADRAERCTVLLSGETGSGKTRAGSVHP